MAEILTCPKCHQDVVANMEGVCPKCSMLPLTEETSGDKGSVTPQVTLVTVKPPVTLSVSRVILAILTGLVTAKVTGFATYFLTAALTGDPRGRGLALAQTLSPLYRFAGGYVAGRFLRRHELALSLVLAVVDILLMIVGWLVARLSGLGDGRFVQELALISPTAYLYELVVGAVPGYGIGGVLALIHRRYLATRTTGTQAAGRGSRIMFRVCGYVLYLFGSLLSVGALVVLMLANRADGPPLFSFTMLILLVTSVGAATLGLVAVEAAKRFIAAAVPPLVGVPPVVFLRSFRDDAISFEPENMIGRFLPQEDRSLEEILVREAKKFGGVGAIGDPKEELPTPGAARVYFESDDNLRWRERAAAYIDECKILIVLLGSSSGLKWEYGQVASRRALARTILVVTPQAGPEGWLCFREAIAAEGINGLPEQLPVDAMLVRFDSGGQPRIYRSELRDSNSYATKLWQALRDKEVGRDAAGDVTQAAPLRPVTWIGMSLMGALWSGYGAFIGIVISSFVTGGDFGERSTLLMVLIPSLFALIGLAFGIHKGSKIKRFS